MDGCLGDAPAKGKARPAKGPAARSPRPASPDAAPPELAPAAAEGWAGRLVALAGAEPVALVAAVTAGGGSGPGARACVVLDAWGRPPPAWLVAALPPGTPLQWARAAGPAAAAAMLEALLQQAEVGRVVLRTLGELWALPPWPRRASGMLALAQRVRAGGSSVVALLGCPRGGCRAAPQPAKRQRTPASKAAEGALQGAVLFPLDAAHAAQNLRRGVRGREFLAWASLRAQTCQCAPSALPLASRSARRPLFQK